MAAAIGRSFSIEVLEALAELRGEHLLEALEEATARRIIEEEPGASARYTFAHALIRETLYASLSGPRRVGLHRRIGAILEQRHAGDPQPPLGELAYHFVAAAEPGTAAKAVDFSARAARRALAALAYEEAARHFDRALKALELSEDADERPAATCCSASVSPTARRASSIRAAPPSKQPRSSRGGQASGSTWHVRRWVSPGVGSSRAPPTPRSSACSRRRSPRCPKTETALRARLLGRLAMELHFSDEPERCQALARQGVALARRLGDPSTLAFALNAHHWAQRGQDEVSELLGIADEIINCAEASAELELALQGHSWRLVDLLELGQTEDDRRRDRQPARNIADRLGQPFYRSWVAGLHPMRALMQGRFDDAERLATDALAAAESAGNWNGITVVQGPARMVLERRRTRRRPGRRGRALRAARSAHPTALRRRGRDVERQPRAVHGRSRSRRAGARVPRPRRRLRRRRTDAKCRRAQRRSARRRGLRAAQR